MFVVNAVGVCLFYIHIHIYIYMCDCVCVFVCVVFFGCAFNRFVVWCVVCLCMCDLLFKFVRLCNCSFVCTYVCLYVYAFVRLYVSIFVSLIY